MLLAPFTVTSLLVPLLKFDVVEYCIWYPVTYESLFHATVILPFEAFFAVEFLTDLSVVVAGLTVITTFLLTVL